MRHPNHTEQSLVPHLDGLVPKVLNLLRVYPTLVGFRRICRSKVRILIDLEVVDSTLVLVVVWINQTSLLPGQSLFLNKSTLCSLMEVFEWVGVDETQTGPE